jgi:hypothetical protein
MNFASRQSIPLTIVSALLALAACWRAFDWHLGDVGGWLSWLGAIGAAAVALQIAGRGRRVRIAERDDEAKTHARLVQVEVNPHTGSPVVLVDVRNYGPLPVLDVDLVNASWAAHPEARWATNWSRREDHGPLAQVDLHRPILKPHTDEDDHSPIKLASHRVTFLHHDEDKPLLGIEPVSPDSPPTAFPRYLMPDISKVVISIRFTTADGIRWEVSTEGMGGGEPRRVRAGEARAAGAP